MADNNNFRRRNNNNERNYSGGDSNRNKNNTHRFNNQNHNSKSSSQNNYLFSNGSVLDFIRRLPLIKNQMRIDGVYNLFYGKEKPFDLKFPSRQFSLKGVTPELFVHDDSDNSSSSSDDDDDENPDSKKRNVIKKVTTKKSTTNSKRRLSTLALDNSSLVPDFDDIDEIHLDLNKIYLDDDVSFSGKNVQSRSFLRAARTSQSGGDGGDDDEDDGGDDDDDNDGDGGNDDHAEENENNNEEQQQVLIYECQNFLEYTQCENLYLKQVAAWKTAKEKYKTKYKKARKFLVDKFGGVARDTMNPFLQRKSDKNIRKAYLAFLNSIISKSSPQDVKDLFLLIQEIKFDSRKQEIISFHSRFHNIHATLHSLNQGISEMMHQLYFRNAIERDHPTRWESAFNKAELCIELTGVTSYWDKHKILLKQLIEKEKKIKAEARKHSQADKVQKAFIAKYKAKVKKDEDKGNPDNKYQNNRNNNSKDNNNNPHNNDHLSKKYPYNCSICGDNNTHDTISHKPELLAKHLRNTNNNHNSNNSSNKSISSSNNNTKYGRVANPSDSTRDEASKILEEELNNMKRENASLAKTIKGLTASLKEIKKGQESDYYGEDEESDYSTPSHPIVRSMRTSMVIPKIHKAKMAKVVSNPKLNYKTSYVTNLRFAHSKKKHSRIISDSGCTAFMTNDISSYDPSSLIYETNIISLGDGNVIYSTLKGKWNCFEDVLYAPDLADTLIPVDYFDELGLEVSYFNGRMSVIDHDTGETVLRGRKATDKLYDIDTNSFNLFERYLRKKKNNHRRALKMPVNKSKDYHVKDINSNNNKTDTTPSTIIDERLDSKKEEILENSQVKKDLVTQQSTQTTNHNSIPTKEFPTNNQNEEINNNIIPRDPILPLNGSISDQTNNNEPKNTNLALPHSRGPETLPPFNSEAERIAYNIGKNRNIQIASQQSITPVEAYIKASGHMTPFQILRGMRLNAFAGHGLTIESVKKHIKRQVPDEALILGSMRAKPIPPSIYSSKEAAMPPKKSNLKLGFIERPPAQPPPFINPLILKDLKPFEIISIDPQGPMPIQSQNHHKYSFHCIDHGTVFRFSYSSKKNNSIAFIKTYEELLHQWILPYGHRNYIIQTDSDPILKDKDLITYFRKKHPHVLFRKSPPMKHEMNGKVENDIDYVYGKVRANLIENNAPANQWDNALQYTIHNLNIQVPFNRDITPLEAVTNRKPNHHRLRPFYSRAYYHITKDERLHNKKFSYRAKKGRFIGYDLLTKDSYLLINEKNTIITRYDVIFNHYPSYEEAKQAIQDDNFLNNYNPTETDEKDEIHSTTNNYQSDNDSVKPAFNIPVPSPIKTRAKNNIYKPKRNSYGLVTHNSPKLTINTYRKYVGNKTSHNQPSNSNPHKLPHTPSTLDEALKSPERDEWIKALRKELQEILKRNTFSFVKNNKLPKGFKAIKSKFAFRVTRELDGSIKYKVRWVGCGYSQVPGKDFDNTYAPCAQAKTFLLLLNLAAINNWTISGIDVGNAYLEALIDKEIYMTLPKELAKDTTYVRLLKSLYGLKQAGELWNQLLNKIITSNGFSRSINDVCLYYKRIGNDIILLLIHVDDVLIASNNPTHINDFKQFLSTAVEKVKDLGVPIPRYLSIDINNKPNQFHSISISQNEYLTKVVNSRAAQLTPKNVPASPTINLRTIPKGDLPPLYDLVGEARFLGDRSRPDILLALSLLGSTMLKPSTQHQTEAYRLFQYLKATPNLSTHFGGKLMELLAFSDASYSPEGDSRSQLGYSVFLNRDSGSFINRSKKAATVADSSAMSEIQALHLCVNEIIWIRSILRELGFFIDHPTPIFIDNKAAEDLCTTYMNSEKSKHINMKINKIRESVFFKEINLIHIHTSLNVADILTKPLAFSDFNKFRTAMLYGINYSKLPIPQINSSEIISNMKALYSKLEIFNYD